MRWKQSVTVVLVCLVTTGLLVGGAASPALAQDDDVPSLPGVYYGDLSLSDGTIDEPVRIEAVADGEVQDTIITEPNGSFGGPTIADDELEVQEPDSGEVEFRIGGTPVEIVSLEGEQIGATTMPWDSGTQEVQLEASTDTVAPVFGVGIDEAPATAEAGTNVTIETTVNNNGPAAATQAVELVNENETVVDSTPVTLGLDNTTTETLTWAIPETDSGSETLTVRSGNETATTTIEVEQPETPSVAPPPGGGGGTGGNPGAIDTGDDEDNGTSNVTPGTLSETQSIVSNTDFGLSQVRFTTDSNIVAITWDGTNISGDVTTTAYNDTPEDVASVPGTMATVSRVTVPENLTTTPAVVQQRVARERLDDINATASDLQMYRYTNGTWTAVETEIDAQTETEIRVEGEVAGFSYLAVSAVSEPTAVATVPSTVTAGDDVTLDASESRDQYGDLVAYNWSVGGESLTGETVTTTFTEAGEHTVELTVTNDAGETATVTETVTVDAAADDDDSGTNGTDTGGETDGSIPGFTSVLAVLAILGGLFIARRRR